MLPTSYNTHSAARRPGSPTAAFRQLWLTSSIKLCLKVDKATTADVACALNDLQDTVPQVGKATQGPTEDRCSGG